MSELGPSQLKRSVQTLFDESADRYAREREQEAGFQRQVRWFLGVAGETGGRRILEVGCGPGSLLSPLSRVASRYTAVDLSEEMVHRFRERTRQLGVPCRVARADAETLPFADDTFDLVLALGLLEYLPSPAPFLREAARVVREGGKLLLSVPSSASPHSMAAGAFRRLPHRLKALLLRRDPKRPLHQVRSHPIRLGRLKAELSSAGFEPGRWRFTQFSFFPLDRLAPGLSRRIADALDPLGSAPGLSRLGAQIMVEGRRAGPVIVGSGAEAQRA